MRRGQTAINGIVLPLVILSMAAVAFGMVVVDIGSNYSLGVDDSSYTRLSEQTDNIQQIANKSSSAIVGGQDSQTNVLESSQRLFTGGYNAILVFSSVPGIYEAVIYSIANSLGIPSAIANLIIVGIIFSIVGVLLFLVLGRS